PWMTSAVETVIYKNQEACKKLREGFHRSPPQRFGSYQNHLSRRPVESTRPDAGMAFFAPWRLGAKRKKAALTENAIAKEIVAAAFRMHTRLGPGLLESVYQTVLAYELGRRGLRTVSQQPIPVVYENVRI